MNYLPKKQNAFFGAKFSSYERLKEIQQGKLYMKNLKFFIDYEEKQGNKGVGDKLEGSLINIRKHKLYIQKEGEEAVEIPIGPAPGIIRDEDSITHPIFCLTLKIVEVKLSNEKKYTGKVIFTEKEQSDFYSNGEKPSVLFIVDMEAFIERIGNAVKKIGIGAHCNRIEYRNKRTPRIIDGKLALDDAFVKDSFFSYQSEYRIELFTSVNDHFILDIGNIEDISILISSQEIDNPYYISIDIDNS